MAMTYPSSARHKVKDGWGGVVRHGSGTTTIWVFAASGKKRKGCSEGPLIVWCNDEQQDSTGNQFHNGMMEWDETITGIDGCLPKSKL
jgi:hypothetical protein